MDENTDNTTEPQVGEKKNMMPMIVAAIVAAVLLLGGAWYFLAGQDTPPAASPSSMIGDTSELAEELPEENDLDEEMESETKEFTLSASNYEFDVTEIRVNEGDTVQVTLEVDEGMHDFVVDEFDVATEVLEEGQSQTIEFVASEAGEYEFYCSVEEHRAMGMVGTLIVE